MGSLHCASIELVSGPDAERVLAECAKRNAFAQIGLPASGYTSGALCWEYSDGRLTVALDENADSTALTIFGLCSLFMVHESLAYLGLGRLLSIRKGDTGILQAEIVAPTAFSTAEPRTSERVPVPMGCGLVTFVYHAGRLIRAKPLNVSLGGMLIETSSSLDGVEVGSVVQLQASWDGISTTLPALVRWCDGASYGLFFNTVAHFGQPGSCPELAAIVQKLLLLKPTGRVAA
ncbi:MAG: PilZ domain-containing protein [Fimbriimonadaceae bacterium]